MRLVTTLLVGTFLTFSGVATAKSVVILCEKDGRPYDDIYEQVRIEENSKGTYDVIRKTAWSGFNGSGEKTQILAKNLTKLVVDRARLVAAGFKPQVAENESTYSSVSFRRISEESVDLQTGNLVKEDVIEVEVYSPLLEQPDGDGARVNSLNLRFSVEDEYSRGCVAG